MSAESGIPTFRGPEGYWKKLDPRQLATRAAFEADPAMIWEWYGGRRSSISAAEPNVAHKAIAGLSRAARDCLVVTQNVDDLHERGGMDAGRLVHIHGEIFVTRCTACELSTREAVAAAPPPRCPRCDALMRPGVVWFGENLDPRQIERVETFLAGGPCDVVLVVGTTATFGYIIDWATGGGPVVEINPEETSLTALATHVIRRPAGDVLPALLAEVSR